MKSKLTDENVFKVNSAINKAYEQIKECLLECGLNNSPIKTLTIRGSRNGNATGISVRYYKST